MLLNTFYVPDILLNNCEKKNIQKQARNIKYIYVLINEWHIVNEILSHSIMHSGDLGMCIEWDEGSE